MPANSNLGYSTQQYQLQPQFDWGSLVGPIVTSVLGALSNSPQLNQIIQPQAAGPMLQPQSSAAYGQLQPQLNLGTLLGPIITSVLGALSSSPQIAQTLQPQAASAIFQPQAAGITYNQLQPQVNLGALIGPIVASVLAALGNAPQLGQSLQPQAASAMYQPQGAGNTYSQLQPQANLGALIGPIVASVLAALTNAPQLGQSLQPQAAGPALQPQSNGVSTYGQLQPQFDFGSLVGPIVTSVLGALSNSPQLAQAAQAQQSAGAQIFH